MRSYGWVLLVLAGVVPCGVIQVAHAQGADRQTVRLEQRVETRLKEIRSDPGAKKALFEKARSDSSFCVHCHGSDGNSTVDEIPRLAGQNPVYLLDQIQRFAEGARQDYIMTGLAKQLSSDDKVTLAVYYSVQQAKKLGNDPAPPEVIARGREKYQAICFACHGSDGKGTKGYARIAGQHERYIIHTLTNFKDGTGGRQSAAMSSVAKGLSDDEITALAAYIHNMD